MVFGGSICYHPIIISFRGLGWDSVETGQYLKFRICLIYRPAINQSTLGLVTGRGRGYKLDEYFIPPTSLWAVAFEGTDKKHSMIISQSISMISRMQDAEESLKNNTAWEVTSVVLAPREWLESYS